MLAAPRSRLGSTATATLSIVHSKRQEHVPSAARSDSMCPELMEDHPVGHRSARIVHRAAFGLDAVHGLELSRWRRSPHQCAVVGRVGAQARRPSSPTARCRERRHCGALRRLRPARLRAVSPTPLSTRPRRRCRCAPRECRPAPSRRAVHAEARLLRRRPRRPTARPCAPPGLERAPTPSRPSCRGRTP